MTTLNQLKALSDITGLSFDGSEGDNRLHFDENRINVYPQYMPRSQYKAMGKHINSFDVTGDGFRIYAWNDVSGYDYWKNDGDGNYIQVSVEIIDADKVNTNDLIDKVYDFFNELYNLYDNTDKHIEYLNKQR